MFSYVFVIGIGEMESVDFGTALKEILFLLYILFSTNALAYQGRFKQKKEEDDSDADFSAAGIKAIVRLNNSFNSPEGSIAAGTPSTTGV